MTKRNAAVHTTGRLLIQLFISIAVYEFIVVLYSFLYRLFAGEFSAKFLKSCWVAHSIAQVLIS